MNVYTEPYITAHHSHLPYSRLHTGTYTAGIMAGKDSSSSGLSTFAEGNWEDVLQTKYDALVAYHSALDPSLRKARRSKPLSGSAEKSVVMVKEFFDNVLSCDNYGGMAAWHEPSESVASWMSQRSPKVKDELSRRAAMMNGKLIFRLTYTRNHRYAPLVWHTLVAEDCSMEALKKAVATSGTMCFTRARGVEATFFRGKFRLRQCPGEVPIVNLLFPSAISFSEVCGPTKVFSDQYKPIYGWKGVDWLKSLIKKHLGQWQQNFPFSNILCVRNRQPT